VEAGGRFKAEAEFDGQGRKKVYEIETFRGLFKDAQGKTYDLRPMETCPSLNNFMRKERGEIQSLLMKAYEE